MSAPPPEADLVVEDDAEAAAAAEALAESNRRREAMWLEQLRWGVPGYGSSGRGLDPNAVPFDNQNHH